jgi:hypothetical protein
LAARKLTLAIAISSCLMAAALPRLARSDDVVLRWKFKEGQALSETMEVQSTSSSHFGGAEMKMTQSMSMSYTRTVQKVGADGTADIAQKVERIRMQMNGSNGQSVDFDSKTGKDVEGPIGDVLMPMFKAMMQSEFKFQMTPLGKVQNVKLPEDLMKAIQRSPTAASAGGMFSEETMKQMCEAFPALFDGPISVGKTWSDHKKIPAQFGVMHADNSYTYEGTEKKYGKELHKFGVKVSLSMQKSADQPVEITVKPNQSPGTLYFDAEAGRVVEMIQSQKVDMEVGGSGAPLVTVSTDTKTTWRLEEKADLPKEAEKAPAEPKKEAK